MDYFPATEDHIDIQNTQHPGERTNPGASKSDSNLSQMRNTRSALLAPPTPILRRKLESPSSSPKHVNRHSIHGSSPNPNNREVSFPVQGRVSLESDPGSLTQSVEKIFARFRTDSDPLPPSHLRSHASATDDESTRKRYFSRTPPSPRSRAVSPLRFIHNLSASLHHHPTPISEEPFVPIDPFKSKVKLDIRSWFRSEKPADIEETEVSTDSSQGGMECDDVIKISSMRDCCSHSYTYIVNVLPQILYLNILLQLPAMYFSRVARIFREAEVSRPDIERMIQAGELDCFLPTQRAPVSHAPQSSGPNGRGKSTHHQLPTQTASGLGVTMQVGMAPTTSTRVPNLYSSEPTPPDISPALIRFKHAWEAFIDSLLREWKTLNVVSALLASAILTIFQIPEAAADPITRTTAIISLICSLMSLTYGCTYIVRFSTMRSMIRASRWAEEARKTKTAVLWNVWVLLAMPAVWLAWSMVIFMVSILSFVWRTGSESDPSERPPLSNTAILGPRITITFIVFIGLIYLALIIKTLKSYGMHGGTHSIINQTTMARPNPAHGGGENALEIAMESRGRQRNRSSSTRVRRREEHPEKKDIPQRSSIIEQRAVDRR